MLSSKYMLKSHQFIAHAVTVKGASLRFLCELVLYCKYFINSTNSSSYFRYL